MTKNRRSLTLTRSKTKRRTGSNERNPDGTFAEGNPGGPGRPHRAIEREYLAVLSDTIPLARWRKIVGKVTSKAERGERWAVEWLSRYLLGDGALNLTELAVRETLGITADNEIAAEGNAVLHPGILKAFAHHDSPTVLDRALKLMTGEKESEAQERIGAEPALQPFRKIIERGADWQDSTLTYWGWIATAPTAEIVEWAKENLEDEANDAALAALAEKMAGKQ